jgi:hypothetical protein
MIAVKRETAVTHFLRDYHEARRLLEEGQTFSVGRWPGHTIETEQQFHAWFLRGLNLKINTYGGILAGRELWRKWDDDYRVQLWRDRQALWQILRQRYRIYQFETQEVRSRYSHLLADPHEDL